jgi:hypothetical protein
VLQALRVRAAPEAEALKLLLEIGNRRCPLLELKVLLLDVVLEVYDRVRALVQHLTSGV